MDGPSVATQLADDHAEIMEEVRGLKAYVVALDERVGILEDFKPMLESIADNLDYFAETFRKSGQAIKVFSILGAPVLLVLGILAYLGVI